MNRQQGEVRLVSVNVGLPRVIGRHASGESIVSGIVKEPVSGDMIRLDALNLAGDRQADLTVHGGTDKAVYAYPVEHLPRWNEELGVEFGVGTFGENLTTIGWLEEEVSTRSRWSQRRRRPPRDVRKGSRSRRARGRGQCRRVGRFVA